jgi:CRISPR/Cas system CSM-associated protein Csm3 (group 7 of RAMP superfamily)
MSTASNTIDIARVVIELESPMLIGRGGGDTIVDSIFVADANGLPAIPGTSTAGVLRSRWAEAGADIEGANSLFGSTDGDDAGPSAVEVSWGHLHDSTDAPVPFAASDERLADPLLGFARETMTREHVRINARGAADSKGHGLFDESVVAAGHRFTIEISVRNRAPEVLCRLVAILADGATRLGGKTRRGFGTFRVARAECGRFDLSQPAGASALAALPADIACAFPEGALEPFEPQGLPQGSRQRVAIDLQPLGGWIFGGGAPHDIFQRDLEVSGGRKERKAPDLLPFTEARVRWQGSRGTFDPAAPDFVIPATGIKGALRHRCVYYANADAGVWAEDFPEIDNTPEPAAVQRLFGFTEEDVSVQQAGRIFVSEARFSESPGRKWVDHVSIDRFSGAPLDGHLFNEMVCFGDPGWKLEVEVDSESLEAGDLWVLRRALEDLAGGALQLGSGSGRGHGWFEGEIAWPGGDQGWGKEATEKEVMA